MWNSRYSESGYAYGTEPNEYFKQEIDRIDVPGSLLLPAEGQGRNAVYAAKKGWRVDAFDISEAGYKKALELAQSNQVTINFEVGTLEEVSVSQHKYDAIGLVYAHFPPPIRTNYHSKFAELLNAGGYIILEGFSKNNLPLRQKNPAVGGPDKLELLFDADQIEHDFMGLKILHLAEEEIELSEGKYHVGTAKVIRFVGKKV